MDNNRQFLENSLQLAPHSSPDVKKLLKTFDEVINAAERAHNENQWSKFLDQYDKEIQTLLDFVQMVSSSTSSRKSKKINRMKDSLKKSPDSNSST